MDLLQRKGRYGRRPPESPGRDGRADEEGERVRLRDGEQADVVASGRDDGKSVMTSRKGIDVGGTGQNGVWVKSAIGPGVTLEKTRS